MLQSRHLRGGEKGKDYENFKSILVNILFFSALYYDPGLPSPLQTAWYRDKDAGACSECCQGRRKLFLHLPPRPDQQPVSDRFLQKVWVQYCRNKRAILQGRNFSYKSHKFSCSTFQRIEPADAHVLEKFLKAEEVTNSHSKLTNGTLNESEQ